MRSLLATWRSADLFPRNPEALKLYREMGQASGSGLRVGLRDLPIFLPAALSAVLCYWQLERLKAKREVIEAVRQELDQGHAVDAFNVPVDDVVPHMKVEARGEYLHPSTMFVGPRPKNFEGQLSQGFTIITPLLDPLRRRVLLVNRGWIPQRMRQEGSSSSLSLCSELAPSLQPEGEVTVRGLVQASEQPSSWMPQNDPDRGAWWSVNVEEMASHLGLPASTLLIQEVDWEAREGPPGPRTYPYRKRPHDLVSFPVMPEDHRNYALTWGSLALATTYMAAQFMKTRRWPSAR